MANRTNALATAPHIQTRKTRRLHLIHKTYQHRQHVVQDMGLTPDPIPPAMDPNSYASAATRWLKKKGTHTALIPTLAAVEASLADPQAEKISYVGATDLSKAFDKMAWKYSFSKDTRGVPSTPSWASASRTLHGRSNLVLSKTKHRSCNSNLMAPRNITPPAGGKQLKSGLQLLW